MHKNEIVNYWIESSDEDIKVVDSLMEKRHYTWALFIGHLVIEKLLKAYYVKQKGTNAPKTHDLSRICELCGIHPDNELEDTLDLITTFNIQARYSDYKNAFHKKCTKGFTEESINKILETREWIMHLLIEK